MVIDAICAITKIIDIGSERLRNNSPRGDYPNSSTIEISQYTENTPGGYRRFAVTQTPQRTHRLTLV